MSDEPSPCLDDQTLAALVSGGLDAAGLREAESHLAECADCRSVVADAAYGAHDSPPGATSQALTRLPAPGDVLAGKYRIEGLLGRGGMGVVLAARHLELGHQVAIKILNSNDSAAAARFLREAKTCAQLVNDHIARVFDLGRLPSGVPYFVLEHLVGEDLSRVIARAPVPVGVAIEYALQACAALREAHAIGVIHRDLKPGNLFVLQRSDGKPWIKVLDFGISKSLAGGSSETSENLTLSQAILGSPVYMSPEQVRASKDLDARSDIWSMGVILYELLTRRRPFTGSTVSSLLVAIATERPPAPSALTAGLPAGLEEVVLRCLEKDPAARFPSVVALADALRQVALGAAAPGAAFAQALHGERRRPWRLIAGAAVAAASLAALALLGPWRAASPAAPPGREVASLAPAGNALTPRLVVHCDRPLPAGSLELLPQVPVPATNLPWQRRLPVSWVCDAEASEPRKQELWNVLSAAPLLASAVIEPAHPFYALHWQQTPQTWEIELTRSATAEVSLELSGPFCREISSVRVLSAGGSSVLAEPAPASDAPESDCRRRVTLPFEAFGTPQSFVFSPPGYRSADAVFTSARLQVEVQRAPVRRRSSRAPAGPCLPPHYCRD